MLHEQHGGIGIPTTNSAYGNKNAFLYISDNEFMMSYTDINYIKIVSSITR